MAQSREKTFRIRMLPPLTPEQAGKALADVRVDPHGREILLPKMRHLNILLAEMECRAANIIKQEMLAVGGDAAVARDAVSCGVPATDIILMGTEKQIRMFASRMQEQPFGLRHLSAQLEEALRNYGRTRFVLSTSRRTIDLTRRTCVMGVVNVTPDSFSDGGLYLSAAAAVDRALALEAEGADMLDIGGESTRPGADVVPAEEEIRRVIPVVRELSKKVNIPISVDTTKAGVAEAAIGEGAEIINDISALTFDPRMAPLIGNSGVAVILMHMRGVPKTMQQGTIVYEDLMAEIIACLGAQSREALRHGVKPDHIVVDPGIGFGKTVRDNLAIIGSLSELKVLGMPILTGVSRKSFIGTVTGVQNPAARVEGTAAALTATILNGSHLVRVHDVAWAKKITALADAIARAEEWTGVSNC